ncbi:winged helix-turn-helix domain-containing protein [Vibrio fluvialis]|nr:winged helix-turn-helix domain-containing protein [Vibrio fluvialis]
MSHNKVTLNKNYFFDIESKVLTNLVGDIISLGENEKRVLSVFVSNKNTVISKKQLIESVWNARGVQVDEASVTQAISSLRRSLSD